MNTQLTTSRFINNAIEIVTSCVQRGKAISAADVWNIQRQKKSRAQRRFAL